MTAGGMANNMGDRAKPDLLIPYIWPRELCWDEGPTGLILRQVPESWWNGLLSERDQLPAEQQLPANFNPWERMAIRPGADLWRKFCEAGASQWRAWRHLTHIGTGAASAKRDPLPIVEAREKGEGVSLTDERAYYHHFLSSTQGRVYWDKMKANLPWHSADFAAAEADWKRLQWRRKKSTNPPPLPKWDNSGEDAFSQPDWLLVERWLVGDRTPGFCWWPSQATADFLCWVSKLNLGTWSAEVARQRASRLGLFNTGITMVSEVAIDAKNHCELRNPSGKPFITLTPTPVSVTAS
ncbi:MAG: hypothetical protein WCK17_19350 [Verrucomicrobiota bacterium]